MGFLDRLLGREDSDRRAPAGTRRPQTDDEQALERYRYLIRTAPPEKIEEVHAEAFAKLTPEQRQQLVTSFAEAGERPASDSPEDLARAGTRAELRQPGTLERSLGGPGRGGYDRGAAAPSMMGMFATSMLGSVAGYVIGSTIMGGLMGGFDGDSSDASGDSGDSGSDNGDSGSDNGDSGSDSSGGDYTSADGGSDYGSDGGDFGGGGDFDMGGGDFDF